MRHSAPARPSLVWHVRFLPESDGTMTPTQLPVLTVGPVADPAAGEPVACILAAIFEGEEPAVEDLPEAVAEALDRLARRPGFRGKEGQRVEGEAGADGPTVVLHGLGKRADVTARKLDRWLSRALDQAATNGAADAAVLLPDHPTSRDDGLAGRLARATVRAGYRFDRLKKSSEAERPGLQRVRLTPPADAGLDAVATERTARAVAGALGFCRDLANTPGNEADPQWMAERAREMAAAHGMGYRCLDLDELTRRGMGGIVAVGAGSAAEPRMVRLEWGEEGPVVALVGKGITFDTGGISIKPASDLDEMKYDKCGACTVLAVARAVVELELPVRLRVYVPLAENMLDGRAYRPGDVIRCYDGKTVEIVNTDAEGRLILADALAWAAEEGPDLLLEYSTLTGAVVVALGQDAGGLYSPDDELAGELLAAAERSGERLWRLPLWPEFAERMKGAHADLKNAGGRWGGANTAAAFLSCFVGGVERWAHLDIAGPAHVGRDGEDPAGATGYGVTFTLDWLIRQGAGD
ncbi:MAG TPA: leucyl aminopeptidase [Thermoanaerobaculia bacterium]|nr:leucyl aminopeptidase [Thermoanaerobaculia bacterium]